MNLYFKDRFGCSTAQIGAFFSIAAIVTALASLCAPLLARRLGTLRTALLFELLSLPFFLAAGLYAAASFTFYLSFRRLPQPPSQPALTAAGLES